MLIESTVFGNITYNVITDIAVLAITMNEVTLIVYPMNEPTLFVYLSSGMQLVNIVSASRLWEAADQTAELHIRYFI